MNNESKTLLDIIDTTGEPNILAEIVSENKLVSENEFTKIFKLNSLDLYVHKAHDEDSGKWFLICSIPMLVVNGFNVSDLKYPIVFDSEGDMNLGFADFDLYNALQFIDELSEEIKKNQSNQIQP
jgi:hypothetical protein